MRTVSQDLIDDLTNVRAIGGRLTFRDRRLIFATDEIAETIAVTSIYDMDSEPYGASEIMRVAKKDDNTLQYRLFLPGEEYPDPWAQVGSISLDADGGLGLHGSRCWYVGSDGYLSYVDFNGTTWGSPVQVKDLDGWLGTTRVSVAPVSSTVCYLQASFDSPLIHSKLYAVDNTGTVLATFHGRVYGDPTQRYAFDAVRISGVDHVYVVDRDSGRAMVTRVEAGVWSELSPVVPIDVVDDDNNFRLGAVSVINGQAWVTGLYSRGGTIRFEMYSIGPDRYSMGRDLFITAAFESELAGKMHLVGNTVHYIGYGGIASAPATMLVGVDSASLKLQTSDVSTIDVSHRASQAANLSVETRSSLTHAAIRKGADVTLEVSVGGHYAQIGVFGLEILSPALSPGGMQRSFGGRGLALRKLDQWESDQSYDYWSQSKMSANPSELAEVVRTTGAWLTDSSILTLQELNLDGFMYTVERACRGASMRGRFRTDDTSGFTGRYGVGVNYYRETRAEAATRLGIEQEDVTEGQYGHNGLFAIYEDGNLEILRIKNSLETQIATAALSVPDNTWHWLQLLFQDGYLRVLYREDGDVEWTAVLETVYEEDGEPWFRDDLGRGAIYVRNQTAYSTTPGFASDSVVVPVASVALFPSSGTVVVDSEHISYSATHTSANIPGDLTVIEGLTHYRADHANTLWGSFEQLLRAQLNVAAPGECPIANDLTNDGAYPYVGQGMGGPWGRSRFDRVDVYMKKVGSPPNPCWIHIVDDRWDWTNRIEGNIVNLWNLSHHMAASVDAADFGTDYGWVTFDLSELYTEPERWVDYAKNGYWIVVTGKENGTITQLDYAVDVDDYYMLKLDEDLEDSVGCSRYLHLGHGGDPDWHFNFFRGDNYQNPDAQVPFRLYGVSSTGPGFEIYLDGAQAVVPADEYTGMALFVVSGPGEGSVFSILAFDYQAPDQWVATQVYREPDSWENHIGDEAHGDWVTPDMSRVFVAEDPSGIIGPGSVVRIMPALTVLARGVDDTQAISHPAGLVSMNNTRRVECDRVEFHSTDIDMRLEDMIAEIAAKAGVFSVQAEKDLDDVVVWTGSGWHAPQAYPLHRNGILRFDMPTLPSGGEVGVSFRMDAASGYTEGYRVTLDDSDNLHLDRYESSTWTRMQTVPLPFSPGGVVEISWFKEHFSVWIGGRFAHSFVDTTCTDGDYAGPVAKEEFSVSADFSAVDKRVDNFILDMGARGTQLISNLIGPKRITFFDAQDGGLKVERLKFSGSPAFTVPDLTIFANWQQVDTERKTLIRAEGAEIAEVADYDAMAEDGYLFGLVNASEANDLWETQNEAQAVLVDSETSGSALSVSGGADPRIEPNDVIEVDLPSESATIIVDGCTLHLQNQPDEVIFDMSLECRYALS